MTLAAGFIVLLDVTIVAVALPSLRQDLDTSASMVQWVVSGYTLTFALALVTGGRLGDAWGRRRMFVVGLTGFVVCSMLAGLAPSIEWLIAARLLQGLAGGVLTPQNTGLIQQLFRGPERGRAFGFFGGTVGLATAVGPLVGGGILALAPGMDGWRWIFYVNVPVGLLALVLAMRFLAKDPQTGRVQLDLVGTGLLGLATLAALFPLVSAEAGGLQRYWWLFAVAVVPGWLFVRWEHRVVARGGAPLLDPRLLTGTPGYAAGVSLATVYFMGFSGIFIVFALYFQDGLGYTPLQSGLSVTAFSIGSAVTAVVAGRLVPRYGRVLTVYGLAVVAIGMSATAVVLLVSPGGSAGWWVAPTLLLAGAGGGFVISPNTTMTLASVPVASGGVASGTLQTGQRVGGAIGTALLPGLFYLVLARSDAGTAVAVALAGAVAVVLLALAVAVVDWRSDVRRARRSSTGDGGNVANGAASSRADRGVRLGEAR